MTLPAKKQFKSRKSIHCPYFQAYTKPNYNQATPHIYKNYSHTHTHTKKKMLGEYAGRKGSLVHCGNI